MIVIVKIYFVFKSPQIKEKGEHKSQNIVSIVKSITMNFVNRVKHFM